MREKRKRRKTNWKSVRRFYPFIGGGGEDISEFVDVDGRPGGKEKRWGRHLISAIPSLAQIVEERRENKPDRACYPFDRPGGERRGGRKMTHNSFHDRGGKKGKAGLTFLADSDAGGKGGKSWG